MILPGNMVQLPDYKDFLSFWAPSGVSPCLQLLLKNPTDQSFIHVLYLPASREDLKGTGTLRYNLTSHHLFLIHPLLLAVGSVELSSSETFCKFDRSEVSLFGCFSRLLSKVQSGHLKEAPEEEPTIGAVQ